MIPARRRAARPAIPRPPSARTTLSTPRSRGWHTNSARPTDHGIPRRALPLRYVLCQDRVQKGMQYNAIYLRAIRPIPTSEEIFASCAEIISPRLYLRDPRFTWYLGEVHMVSRRGSHGISARCA